MHGCPIRETRTQFLDCWTLGNVSNLAQQVIGQRHSGLGGTCLQLAMKVVGYMPQLDHCRHVQNIQACGTHVNALWQSVPAERSRPETFATKCRRISKPHGVRIMAAMPVAEETRPSPDPEHFRWKPFTMDAALR